MFMFVCVCLSACICTKCVQEGVQGGRKRDLLEMELQVVVGHYLGAGNWTQVLAKAVIALNHCGGYSWLSTLLCLELAKTQESGYTCEGFFLVELFGVRRPTLSLDLLRWHNP